MNEIDVNHVLAQIRALGAQAGVRPQTAPAAVNGVNGGFQNFLSASLERVNGAQSQATGLQQRFELGDPSADLASVMLATAKAQVSFKAVAEVRNRLVNAYQEIMNMPI